MPDFTPERRAELIAESKKNYWARVDDDEIAYLLAAADERDRLAVENAALRERVTELDVENHELRHFSLVHAVRKAATEPLTKGDR